MNGEDDHTPPRGQVPTPSTRPRSVTGAASAVTDPETDPRVYLPQDVTARERAVLESIDRNTGDAAPAYMVAKLAIRLEEALLVQRDHAASIEVLNPKRIERLEAFSRLIQAERRTVRRWAIAAILAAVGSTGTFAVWALGRADAAGAARDHMMTVDRDVKKLEDEIGQIRLQLWELRKLSDQSPSSGMSITLGSSLPPEFDGPEIVPMGCDAPCTTGVQCGDAHSDCHYCYQGKCSSILPAQPEPDAGVDSTASTFEETRNP